MDTKYCRDIRYYIDLDLKNSKIINHGYGDKNILSQELNIPNSQRVFITKGQYNKLMDKMNLIKNI